jgi:predicted DNA-binding transcriptional regulator YafY
MRADRLLSILMLLQTRGRMTARSLAEQLEVCERTIYRDLDALSASGVPVYADRGPGGGCELDENYRTTLTGLKQDELRALFMLTGPASAAPGPLAALGVGPELRSALLKLTAALTATLPAARRQEEERVRQRIHLDSVSWFQAEEPVPHLHTLQQAVWEDRRLEILYRPRYRLDVRRRVDAYGLVAKTNIWYLVGQRDGLWRVYQVARILEARLLDEPFERDTAFNLAEYWSRWCAGYENDRPSFTVRARVSPALLDELPAHFGESIRAAIEKASPPDPAGWRALDLEFESFEAARDRILGLGRAIEVQEPLALRLTIIDYAQQIVGLYERK